MQDPLQQDFAVSCREDSAGLAPGCTPHPARRSVATGRTASPGLPGGRGLLLFPAEWGVPHPPPAPPRLPAVLAAAPASPAGLTQGRGSRGRSFIYTRIDRDRVQLCPAHAVRPATTSARRPHGLPPRPRPPSPLMGLLSKLDKKREQASREARRSADNLQSLLIQRKFFTLIFPFPLQYIILQQFTSIS